MTPPDPPRDRAADPERDRFPDRLPDGLSFVRSTPTFDADSVPDGLLAAHRVADGVWGRLVVESGSLTFVFEADAPTESGVGGADRAAGVGPVVGAGKVVVAGEDRVIPPNEPHHLVIDGPVRFRVEFHR